MRKCMIAVVLSPFVSVAAHAAVITPTVTTSAGTTYNTAALTGFSTNSADMMGSVVTVRFAGGTSGTAIWGATGASTAAWSLSVAGDTFGSTWTLANIGTLAILGMNFNGVPGNTTFDIVDSPSDSPGSADGRPFSNVNGPAGMTVAALYTNRLQVGGVFYDDLYTTLDLTFGGGGLTSRNNLTFLADTDNASAARGGITPGIPEPATWAMMMIGFGGIGFALRRRPKVTARIRFA